MAVVPPAGNRSKIFTSQSSFSSAASRRLFSAFSTGYRFSTFRSSSCNSAYAPRSAASNIAISRASVSPRRGL